MTGWGADEYLRPAGYLHHVLPDICSTVVCEHGTVPGISIIIYFINNVIIISFL